jgi:uncharacterized iron-regulated protein
MNTKIVDELNQAYDELKSLENKAEKLLDAELYDQAVALGPQIGTA